MQQFTAEWTFKDDFAGRWSLDEEFSRGWYMLLCTSCTCHLALPHLLGRYGVELHLAFAKGTPVIVKRGTHRDHDRLLGTVCTVAGFKVLHGQIDAVFVEECNEPIERLAYEHWALVDGKTLEVQLLG